MSHDLGVHGDIQSWFQFQETSETVFYEICYISHLGTCNLAHVVIQMVTTEDTSLIGTHLQVPTPLKTVHNTL